LKAATTIDPNTCLDPSAIETRDIGYLDANGNAVGFGPTPNKTYLPGLVRSGQPIALANGHTGAGSTVAIIEKNAASWEFQFDDGRPLPFGICDKPDGVLDHLGWQPLSPDSAQPCKIDWVMCVAADGVASPSNDGGSTSFMLPAHSVDGEARIGLKECSVKAENTVAGGHATTSAAGVAATAPDARFVIISVPDNTALSIRAALNWLVTAGDDYVAGAPDPLASDKLYLSSADSAAWADHLTNTFGDQTPADQWRIVAASMSLNIGQVFTEACAASGPAMASSDTDGDGIIDVLDNCPDHPNPAVVSSFPFTGFGVAAWATVLMQPDSDYDGWGNRCDRDFDQDGSFGFTADAAIIRAVIKDIGLANIDQDQDLEVNDADDQALAGENSLCPGIDPVKLDFNCDGTYDAADVVLALSTDINSDGFVDVADLQLVAGDLWFAPSGPSRSRGAEFRSFLQASGDFAPQRYIFDSRLASIGLPGSEARAMSGMFADFDADIALLRTHGVASLFSAGNVGMGNAVTAPACTKGAIAVTGLGHQSEYRIAKNFLTRTKSEGGVVTNMSPTLTIISSHGATPNWLWTQWNNAAPSQSEVVAGIAGCHVDPWTTNGGASSWGVPVVAGAVALLRGYSLDPNDNLSVDGVVQLLRKSDRLAYFTPPCKLSGATTAATKDNYSSINHDYWCTDTVLPTITDPADPNYPGDPESMRAWYSRPLLDIGAAVQFAAGYTGPDTDADGFFDSVDNCVQFSNPAQKDSDGDGYGNRCDADFDQDGDIDAADDALFTEYAGFGKSYADIDEDGDVDGDDASLMASLLGNPLGDSGLDRDHDGIPNHIDNCENHANGPWTYGDAFSDKVQADADNDGFGNRCDADFDNDGLVTWFDGVLLVGAISGGADPATEPASRIFDLNSDGAVNSADTALMINDLYANPPAPPGPSGLCYDSPLFSDGRLDDCVFPDL
jgi:hypothetical protein